jgi:hypothetical protein
VLTPGLVQPSKVMQVPARRLVLGRWVFALAGPADTGAAGRAGDGVGAGTGLAGTSTLACCLGNVKGARLGSGPSGSAAVGSVIVEAGEGAAGIVAKGTCGSSTRIAAITTGSGLPL